MHSIRYRLLNKKFRIVNYLQRDINYHSIYLPINLTYSGYKCLYLLQSQLFKLQSIYILPSSNPPPNQIYTIFHFLFLHSLIDGDLNSLHPAWNSSHHVHCDNILYSKLFCNYFLSLINLRSPAHVNLTSHQNPAIDICTWGFIDMGVICLGSVRLTIYGRDHISVVVNHIDLYSTSPFCTSHLLTQYIYRFNILKVD